MQNHLSWALAAALIGLLPGLASASLSVFACEPEWKALVEEIGGSDVTVYSATTGMQDPHHIEARPSLIAKARSADLLVCTGGELEIGWLPVVQRRSGNPAIQGRSDAVFFAADLVDRLEVPDSVDRADGDVHASGNPHVHLDPHRLLLIGRQLANTMKRQDPTNAEAHEKRWQSFESRWLQAISQWEQRTAGLEGTKVIVHHRSWSYLFDWLEWQVVAELEPVPGSPPTTRHLSSLLATVAQEKPVAVLLASFQNPRGAKWIAERIDLPVVSLPFTIGGAEDTDSLFSLFDEIISRLLTAVSTNAQ